MAVPYQIDPTVGVQLVDEELSRSVPSTKYEYVTVTFNVTANTDTDIAHSLNSTDLGYLVVGWNFALPPATTPVIYRDSSGSAKAWQKNYLILRCNVASVSVTLLLFVKR